MTALETAGVAIRAFDDPESVDVERWTDAYNHGGEARVTLDEVRRSMREHAGRELRLLAERDSAVLGMGRAVPPKADRPDGHTYLFVRLAGAPEGGPAIADALFAELATWTREHATRRCNAWIRDDESGACGVEFWARHGFGVVARELVVGIDPREVDPPTPGWDVATLAERPDLVDAAYETYVATFVDVPMVDAHPPDDRATWIETVTSAPQHGLDHVFVAIDGSAVVGLGVLERQLARPGVAWHEMLGVLRPWRGRGVATAIKQAQLRWAREHGLTELRAGNDEHNHAMRHVNARLGYAPRFTFVELVGEV